MTDLWRMTVWFDEDNTEGLEDMEMEVEVEHDTSAAEVISLVVDRMTKVLKDMDITMPTVVKIEALKVYP